LTKTLTIPVHSHLSPCKVSYRKRSLGPVTLFSGVTQWLF
jgi:hypothetical protein